MVPHIFIILLCKGRMKVVTTFKLWKKKKDKKKRQKKKRERERDAFFCLSLNIERDAKNQNLFV